MTPKPLIHLIFACAFMLFSCTSEATNTSSLFSSNNPQETSSASSEEASSFSSSSSNGTNTYRGFILDQVTTDRNGNSIHYNINVPDSYNDYNPSPLYISLPGYEGLYFQGVGANVYAEYMPHVAQSYIENMIVIAPQLNDWRQTSANQTYA